MQRSIRATVDLSKVLLWTNWIDSASYRLSFTLPPKELLILFVVQSLELAHSLNSILGERLPEEVVDGHIRGYLLDRVWSFHLLAEDVRKDVMACGKVDQIDSKKLLGTSRSMVARIMLGKGSNEDITIRTLACRAVLRGL